MDTLGILSDFPLDLLLACALLRHQTLRSRQGRMAVVNDRQSRHQAILFYQRRTMV